ncbi:MAG: helix-turn-helix transcriptional regulator [Desulfovibrio sp.]|nr:helix-turn-helix transcriptional regulator [Desulfovibrio sp.]
MAAQRKLANMTQVQVADRLGIEKETVSRLETGVIPPSLQDWSNWPIFLAVPSDTFSGMN